MVVFISSYFVGSCHIREERNHERGGKETAGAYLHMPLCVMTLFMLIVTTQHGRCDEFHFTSEESEAQRC